MSPPVVRLTAKNLEPALTRTRWALLRLDRTPRPVLHRGLAEALDRRFPGLFSFAVLTRSELRPEVLEASFRTALGGIRGGVKDGYLLVEDGLVVGHHGGETRPASVRYGVEEDPSIADDPVLREVARASVTEAEALRQLLAYLVPLIERKHRAAGYRSTPMSDGPREPSSGRRPEPPPPPRPPPPAAPTPPPAAAEDPYALLGVTPASTDEEVKAAWKHQMKLNHPDKVAHLSPALQKFAEQQTLALMRAYEAIVARRKRH